MAMWRQILMVKHIGSPGCENEKKTGLGRFFFMAGLIQVSATKRVIAAAANVMHPATTLKIARFFAS